MTSDNRLGEFLRARRELVRPEDHGMPAPGRRRVPGLRREEVAMLAGVSTDYYVRLEQGRELNPSAQVLDALASALGLDGEAIRYLHDLTRAIPRRQRHRQPPEQVGAGMVRLMAHWPDTPALVLGLHMDLLARNTLGTALFGWLDDGDNVLRAIFLDPVAREFYGDWAMVARNCVAGLRAAAGVDPDSSRLTELVGELSVKSPEFVQLWARHDVRGKTNEAKLYRHPVVGELTLSYEALTINSAPGQQLMVYQAEPGSPSERTLRLLGSLAVTEPSTTADEQRNSHDSH